MENPGRRLNVDLHYNTPNLEGAAVMRGRTVLLTGSCGLIGSEVTRSFARLGFKPTGIDSNQRAVFCGPEGDTSWTLAQLKADVPDYRHVGIDSGSAKAGSDSGHDW